MYQLVENDSKTFLIENSIRRRILDHHDLCSWELSLNSPVQVTKSELEKSKFGPHLPRRWHFEDWLEPPRNSKRYMREIVVSRCQGKGMEFGAGSRPLPLPLGSNTVYAEYDTSSEQMSRMFKGSKQFVEVSHLDSLDSMTSLKNDSLDYICASHVIEHVKNPLNAFYRAYRCLKDNGFFILVVPDKRVTFDKHRQVTLLSHLIKDFEDPSQERDFEHYIDFFKNAAHSKSPEDDAIRAQYQGKDIHFHVWDLAGFYEVVDYTRKTFAPWSEVWHWPRVDHPKALEFYFALRK